MTERQRQDASLKDPMNYRPDLAGDVGDGDTANIDCAGFNGDLKANPDP